MSNRFVNPFPRFFDNAGALLNGGLLNFYENDGGTTRKDTYSDAELTVVNANPVVLTASGVVPDIFLNGEYRVVLTDEDGVQLDSAEDVNVDSFTVDDANNNGVTDVITMTHTTTGTPQAGIGTGLGFATETAAGNTETGMALDAVTTDVTPGSEDFDFVVNLMSGGATAAEAFRVTASGVVKPVNDILFTQANPEILGGDTNGVLIIGPSTSNALGGIAKFYGDTHATKAGDIEFLDDTTITYHYDASATSHDFTGTVTGGTFEPTGDTSAGDNAAFGYTATEGAIITGQGSTNDVTIKNDADGTVMQIPTGTTNADFPGTVKTDTINESTPTSGVTIDNLLIKDNGVFLGGAGDANKLSDYEEGTFTFGVEDGSANAVTLDNTTGYYTKIGRLVNLTIYIDASSLGSATGAIKVTGIPFFAATGAGANQTTGLYCALGSNLNVGAAGESITAKIDGASTEADLQIWNVATGSADFTAAELSADGIILLTGSYWSDP